MSKESTRRPEGIVLKCVLALRVKVVWLPFEGKYTCNSIDQELQNLGSISHMATYRSVCMLPPTLQKHFVFFFFEPKCTMLYTKGLKLGGRAELLISLFCEVILRSDCTIHSLPPPHTVTGIILKVTGY